MRIANGIVRAGIRKMGNAGSWARLLAKLQKGNSIECKSNAN
jgi:hypothetical protein